MGLKDNCFDDPCKDCIVKPICSDECERSKSYEIVISFLEFFNQVPNEKEIKENGLTIITGENNGRTKRRKDRKNTKKKIREIKI